MLKLMNYMSFGLLELFFYWEGLSIWPNSNPFETELYFGQNWRVVADSKSLNLMLISPMLEFFSLCFDPRKTLVISRKFWNFQKWPIFCFGLYGTLYVRISLRVKHEVCRGLVKVSFDMNFVIFWILWLDLWIFEVSVACWIYWVIPVLSTVLEWAKRDP